MAKNILRRLARFFGGVVLFIFFWIFILGALDPSEEEIDPEAIKELYPMFGMVFGYLCAYIFTWFPKRKGELIGGIVICLLSIGMGGSIVLSRGWDKWSFGLAYTIPFLLPGVLFLVDWHLRRKTPPKQD